MTKVEVGCQKRISNKSAGRCSNTSATAPSINTPCTGNQQTHCTLNTRSIVTPSSGHLSGISGGHQAKGTFCACNSAHACDEGAPGTRGPFRGPGPLCAKQRGPLNLSGACCWHLRQRSQQYNNWSTESRANNYQQLAATGNPLKFAHFGAKGYVRQAKQKRDARREPKRGSKCEATN